MAEKSYNIGTFVKNVRENGIRGALNEGLSQALERGYLTRVPLDVLIRSSKAVASGAVVGVPLFIFGKGLDSVVTSFGTVPEVVVMVPYTLLSSLFTSFAIGDGYEENRIQILQTPKKEPSMVVYHSDGRVTDYYEIDR